jgi:hypothetical protein
MIGAAFATPDAGKLSVHRKKSRQFTKKKALILR